MFTGGPLEKLWSMYMAGCVISKVYLKNVNDKKYLLEYVSFFKRWGKEIY